MSRRRGRPLSLLQEQKFLVNLREAGGGVNRHVVSAVLLGLIKSDMARYGTYVDFVVTRGWMQSLYKRMQFSRRMVTTSRPIVTKSIWEEVKSKFLHDIVKLCIEHNIPDELIINIGQTPSKYVPTDRVTMAKKGSKHVSRKGSADKRNYCNIF